MNQIIQSTDYTYTFNLEMDEANHVYKLDGERVVGVTTALERGYPESEYLTRWRIKQGIGEYENKTIVKAAGSIGSVLHDYAHYYTLRDKDKLNEVNARIEQHPDKEKIMRTIDQFVKWYTPMDVVLSEAICASWRHKFGGKIDLLVKQNGKLILLDYKTSKGIYVKHLIQLGLYAIALKEWYNYKVDEIRVVRFDKNGGEFDPHKNVKRIKSSKVIKELKLQGIRTVETYYFREEHDK